MILIIKMSFYFLSFFSFLFFSFRYMASTQFEATDARRAFPCWDEPNLKATFTIELEVDKSLTALSNMDVKEETILDSQWKLVKFNKSPIMSTYLVAYVVGDIDFVSSTTKSNIPVRVYAPKGFAHQGKFSVDVAAKILDFFTDYFEQPYPLPKMDMIGIPDFAMGAMENWGLVTYRMNALLFDEEASSLSAKQRVTYVVAHELAHQVKILFFDILILIDLYFRMEKMYFS